jgi:ABC-type Mn2+/Zn2+ transport system permease subunit
VLATVWEALLEPWSEPVLRRALAEVVLVGLAGGTLGCWIVPYGLAYSAESLAHALLPGLVVATLAGFPLVLGGAAGLVVAAAAIAAAGRVGGIGRDAAVAVVVTGMLGLGVLLALSPETPAGLGRLLFGDVLGVTERDVALAGALAAVVLAALRILHPTLLLVGFDRLNARALGRAPGRADLALLLLLALTLLVAVQGLGNLLVVAVLVGPAAAARVLTRRMGPMLAASAAIAVVAGVAGLEASHHLRTAAGASIAAVLVLAYGVALAVRGVRALVP